ncbi:unnamed protein product [Didymodactylos carnosus]|nr:unnamed protein product [Didymodactylos carnosus]CAF3709769.1 unnamed protein product [Didymodactylos carnosus]
MPIIFKKLPQSVALPLTASHITNNLTILRTEQKGLTSFASAHKSGVSIFVTTDDFSKQNQAQVWCRSSSAPSAAADNEAQSLSYVIEAKFIILPIRTLLVIACGKSVQMFESDGSVNVHIHMLPNSPNKSGLEKHSFFISSVALLKPYISESSIYARAHQCGVTNIVSNDEILISSDTLGVILIWNISTMLQRNKIDPVSDSGITSMGLWNNYLASSYANGMIRIYDVEAGASLRPLYWQSTDNELFVLKISHQCNYRIENNQLVGVRFLSRTKNDLAVCGYDYQEITILKA